MTINSQRNDRFDCDLLFWELSPGLLDGVRDRLQAVQRIEGACLITERGTWKETRVLIAAPLVQEASQKVSNELTRNAIDTLVTTHHPQTLFIIGEGLCEASRCPKLPLMWAVGIHNASQDHFVFDLQDERRLPFKEFPRGLLTEGPVRLSEVDGELPLIATNWPKQLFNAIKESSFPTVCLAAVSPQEIVSDVLESDETNPSPKFARKLGRLWGQLWNQPGALVDSIKESTNRWNRQNQIANQLETVLDELA